MDCYPHLHVAAYHAEPGYNGDTPGLGVLCPLAPNMRLGVGTYHNSVRTQSHYAGVNYQPWRMGALSAGAFAGVVSGYRVSPLPFGAAVASLDMGWGRLHGAFIPHVNGLSPATVEFSLEFALKR